MYGREKRVLLREYLQQGLTKAALADKGCVSTPVEKERRSSTSS